MATAKSPKPTDTSTTSEAAAATNTGRLDPGDVKPADPTTPDPPATEPTVATPAAPTSAPLAEPLAPEPTLSYEQARDELLAVVNRLESGKESLAESMELFKRGEYLVNLCEHYLSTAQASVDATKEV